MVKHVGSRAVDEDGEPIYTEDEGMSESGAEDTVKFEGFENNDDDEDEDETWEEVQIGRVYESTIGELGDVLGGEPIGIITDE